MNNPGRLAPSLQVSVNRSTYGPKVEVLPGYLHMPSNSRLLPQADPNNRPAAKQAVFLDRDGVVVEDVGYLSDPRGLILNPGVSEAIKALQARFYILVVTNQSGIARGMFTENDLLCIHTELVRRLSQEGAILDGLLYCPHYEDGPVQAYQLVCECRKPKPGMLLRAAQEWGIDLIGSFMAGDQPTDVAAGLAAGATSILIIEDAEATMQQTMRATNLSQASELILERVRGGTASGNN